MPCKSGNYVCNALTGEILLFSEAGLKALTTLQENIEFPNKVEFEKILKEKMFLFDSEEEEQQVFREICEKSFMEFREHFPPHYTFIVNTQCNFNCPYCFELESNRRVANTLSEAQIDSAFKIIDQQTLEQSQLEGAGIEIFGGEPLLPVSKTSIEHILKSIAERNLTVSIQTNGFYLLDFLSLISEYSQFISLIQITLDGPPRFHNRRRITRGGEPTFDRLVEGIDKFLQLNLPIQLNLRTNVDLENLDSLGELMEFYKKKNWVNNPWVSFVAAPVDNRCGNLASLSKLLAWNTLFKHVFPISKDNKGVFDLSVFKALTYFRNYFSAIASGNPTSNLFIPKIVYCEAAAFKLFVFHPDGQIYPCPESVSTSDLAIGTYFPIFHFYPERSLQWQNQTILQREQCPSCEVSTFCGGGCILTALLQNGSMRKPVCEDTPEIITAYLNKITNLI